MKIVIMLGLIAFNAFALTTPGIEECTPLALRRLRCYDLGSREVNQVGLSPRNYTHLCMEHSRDQGAWCAKAEIDPLHGNNNCFACYR